MQPHEAFAIYNSCRLHFTTESYDAVKYNFKTSVSQKTFFGRRDKYFFDKVSRKYPDRQELISFFVSNFVAHDKINTFAKTDQYDLTFLEWQKRIQSLSYLFRQDIAELKREVPNFDELLTAKNGSVPIVNLWINHKVSIETVVILDILTNFAQRANGVVTETILWPEFYRKLIKYKPFVKVNAEKYRKIVLSEFTS